jgi:hypothetical protein
VSSGLGAGKASFSAINDTRQNDYGNIGNAIGSPNPPHSPALVSFDVEWSGVVDRGSFSDSSPTHQFQLDFVDTGATVKWSGKNLTTGATFESGANDAPLFARLAHERNGSFFNSGT